METSKTLERSLLGAACAALFLAAAPAFASNDGPEVARAIQEAVNPEDVNRVLIWVQLSGTAPIKDGRTPAWVVDAGKAPSVEQERDVLAERIREAIAAQSRQARALAIAHQQ